MNITNTDQTRGFLVPEPIDAFIFDELADLCRITGAAITRLVPGEQFFSVPDQEYDAIESLFIECMQEIKR